MATKEYFPGLGKRCVPKAVTSLASGQKNSRGMVTLTRCKLQRIRWMQALSSCRS